MDGGPAEHTLADWRSGIFDALDKAELRMRNNLLNAAEKAIQEL